MIGSPWNPFFTQASPSIAGKYDSSELDNTISNPASANQMGSIDKHSQPTFLQLRTSGSSSPFAILQRNYAMHSEVDLFAAQWAATFPELWGTDLFSDIFGTMYLWYYSLFSGLSGRMLWQSPTDSDGYRWYFGVGWMHPAAYGLLSDNGYFDRSTVSYDGPLASYGSFTGQGVNSTPDWPRLWTLFYTDALPSATDGAEEGFDHPAFSAVDTYPVYINSTFSYVRPIDETRSETIHVADPNDAYADIRFGLKAYSAIDLQFENNMTLLTTGGPSNVKVAPWYK